MSTQIRRTCPQQISHHQQHTKEINPFWESMLIELTKFIRDHWRLPSKFAMTPWEQYLGEWLSTQIRNGRHNNCAMSDSNRRDRLAAIITPMSQVSDDRWYQIMIQLHMFLATNGRTPHKRSNNRGEQCLARWMRIQHFNYTRGLESMRSEYRRSGWTNLVATHAALFSQRSLASSA